ncbi:MAG TPA: GNAT family N-acetyltransferase [Streptosporangiaceae bacterium]|nr:GNAT family N-acetyltransferase [Streptosporangiaceae bacterium]
MTEVSIRVAADADLPGVRAVAAHFDLLADWPQPPDFLDLERRHGRLAVATDAGAVIGFAGILPRGPLTHLGNLFVLPDAQSAGLGGALLRFVLPRDRPVTTYASSDPRALALYVRHGLRPIHPLLYLTGPTGRMPVPEVSPRRATVAEIAALDATVGGGHRPTHLAWYEGRPGVQVWTVPDGYAVTRTRGTGVLVGPAGGRHPDACVDAVLAAVHQAAGTADEVQVAVFGPHPALPVLLAAGLHIDDQDTLMTTADGLIAVDRYVPQPDLG